MDRIRLCHRRMVCTQDQEAVPCELGEAGLGVGGDGSFSGADLLRLRGSDLEQWPRRAGRVTESRSVRDEWTVSASATAEWYAPCELGEAGLGVGGDGSFSGADLLRLRGSDLSKLVRASSRLHHLEQWPRRAGRVTESRSVRDEWTVSASATAEWYAASSAGGDLAARTRLLVLRAYHSAVAEADTVHSSLTIATSRRPKRSRRRRLRGLLRQVRTAPPPHY
jgi:phage terminase Nu1 subunit (DNA packaging protein)